MKKKVLIITYYWPPAGGGGVMPWLKMSRYLLEDTEWQPLIYTPENAGYLVVDKSMEKEVPKGIEVIKYPIVEPNNFLSILGLGKLKKSIASGGVSTGNHKKSIKEKIILWIRSNIFIPDARFLWIRPSTKFLPKILKEKKIDAIITTGPPHSMHLIGLKLKKKTGIPWIADYRDPWTFIDFFEDLNLSAASYRKHLALEKSVLENADALVTVSPSWAKEFKKRFNVDFFINYNGFDPADFSNVELSSLDKNFTITYVGALNKDRNPAIFWKVVKELCNENLQFKEKLKVRLIGSITPELHGIIQELELADSIFIESHKPHKEVIQLIQKSQLLLLLINNTANVGGIIPGKLYEYLGAQRPILCIGDPEADAAHIIEESKAGKVVHFDHSKEMKAALLEFFEEYMENGHVSSKTENFERFSSRENALEYSRLLDKVRVKK